MRRFPLQPLLFAVLLAGCPTFGADDDDVSDDDDLFSGDDDDATGDDDDSVADDDDAADDDDDSIPSVPIYGDEETYFALSPGNTWRFTETTAAVPDPVIDDVVVTVVQRLSAVILPGDWEDDMAALEITIDRVFGDDETHWYGLNGTGTVYWLGSELQSGFDVETIEGDGGTVLSGAANLDDLAGDSFDAAWFLADDGETSLDTEAVGEAPCLYDGGPKEGVDCLETIVERGGADAGFQYWKPSWGLLGMEIELSGSPRTWDIEACSVCPGSSGLPAQ